MMNFPVSRFDPSLPWARTVWDEEVAWTSVSGGVCAIVSEVRSRLIYFGAHDGSVNLLNAPQSRVSADEGNPYPNQGGHRFWLGPQRNWIWPPPTEWEYAAAMSVAVDRETLILKHAHIDPDYPAITREYAWEENRLRCTVRWPDDRRPYFGMHVIAVDAPFVITARLEPSSAAPAGLVLARMVDEVPSIELPHPAISVRGGCATVRSGIREVKLGFISQPLTIERPEGWSLSVHPGPCGRACLDMPDHGYLSQLWVGGDSSDFAEIEQLTPYLHGDASGQCSSTIFIEASRQIFQCISEEILDEAP